MTESPNVFQRIVMAYELIARMPFTQCLANSQYKSVPIGQMRAAVREVCSKVGLVHVGPLKVHMDRTKDGATFRHVGSCVFRYVNASDPEDYVEYESYGEAMDNGDKGVAKFYTNLLKNHFKATWDIDVQTGEDDIDSYSNEDYYATEASAKRYQQISASTSTDASYGKKSIAEHDEKNRLLDLIEGIPSGTPGYASAKAKMTALKGQKKTPITSWGVDDLKAVLDAAGVKY